MLFTTFSGRISTSRFTPGEGYGKESIWQAIQYCGAHRIGHGTRLIDDIAVVDGKAVKLGDLAQYVLDKRIPLEICLHQQRPHRRHAQPGRASLQDSLSGKISRHAEHRQPVDEQHHA